MGGQEESVIVKLIIENNKRLEELKTALTTHIQSEESVIKKFMEGFPTGDLEGHRRYHEALIKSEESREKMRQAIITKSLVSLVWFALCLFVGLIWQDVKNGLLPEKVDQLTKVINK